MSELHVVTIRFKEDYELKSPVMMLLLLLTDSAKVQTDELVNINKLNVGALCEVIASHIEWLSTTTTTTLVATVIKGLWCRNLKEA